MNITLAGQEPQNIRDALELLLKQQKNMEKRIEELELDSKIKDQQIRELQYELQYSEENDYYGIILKNDELVSTTEIAEDYGMSVNEFNILLENCNVQHKVGDVWFANKTLVNGAFLYPQFSRAIEEGREIFKLEFHWSQKGRLFLYQRLKEEGIFPLMETK